MATKEEKKEQDNLAIYEKAREVPKTALKQIFGGRLKIGHNRKKSVMRHTLKKRGYIIPFRGASVAYHTDDTNRSAVVECHAKEVGIEIKGYGY